MIIFIKLHEMSTGKNISVMWDQDFIKRNSQNYMHTMSSDNSAIENTILTYSLIRLIH